MWRGNARHRLKRAALTGLAVGGLLLIFSARSLSAQGEALTLDEYWQRLSHTAVIVQQAELSGQDVRPALAAEADFWEGVTEVVLPDQTHQPIDTSALVALLRANPPDISLIDRTLNVLLEAHNRWPQFDPGSSGVDSQAALDSILSNPRFNRSVPGPNPIRQWIDRQVARLLAWISRLLPGSLGGSLVRVGLTALGMLLLVFVLATALRGLIGSFVGEYESDEDDVLPGEQISSEGALKRAQVLSAEGDYRSAVRYLYLSSLLLLEERGLLRYDRSRTNREVLSSVRGHDELASPLRDVIEVFDRVWYGFQPVDDETYRRYEARVKQLRRQ